MTSEVKAPVPVAWGLEWTFNGDERGLRLYDDERHCLLDAESDGGICSALVRQSDALAYAAARVWEAEVAAEREAASLRLQVSSLTTRLDSKNAELRAMRALAQETKT